MGAGRDLAGLGYAMLAAMHGVAATYRAPDGSTVATTVLFQETDATGGAVFGGAADEQVRHAIVDCDPNAVATPVHYGAFVVDSVQWMIVAVPNLRGGWWRCTCEARTRDVTNRQRADGA